ncbi:hypothetical protein C0Q70_11888 [Pomacea canaliculata]|uniref:Uncharacterized protein n=1 Tax=Pomacea canaliculata TaxID=400727 RepID=A0A2T7P7A5_POMCA|nr:hypothetical protein C0Q70_11888 [Pomacea canaliculata]
MHTRPVLCQLHSQPHPVQPDVAPLPHRLPPDHLWAAPPSASREQPAAPGQQHDVQTGRPRRQQLPPTAAPLLPRQEHPRPPAGHGVSTRDRCGLRAEGFSQPQDVSRKESPPSSSSQEGVGPAGSQLVTSPLCPNILACRRTCLADKSRQCSVAAASASQRGPCDDAPVFASDAQHKQHANVGGAVDPCVHDGVTSETVATTHAPSGTNPRHSQTLQDDSRLRASSPGRRQQRCAGGV